MLVLRRLRLVEPAELLNLLLWLWLWLLWLWRLVELRPVLHHLRDLPVKRLVLRHQSVNLRFLLFNDALVCVVVGLCLLLLLRFCLLCLLLLLWLCRFCLLLLWLGLWLWLGLGLGFSHC